MKAFVTVVAAVLLCAASVAATDSTPLTGLTGLKFVGRIDNLEGPLNIHFDWAGVELDVSVSVPAPGPSGVISLILSDEGNLFNVFVDGATTPTSIVQTGANSGAPTPYPIANGLSAGPHTIVITKRTEADVGISIFHGFQFASSSGDDRVVIGADACLDLHRESVKLAESQDAPASTRQLEFFGDSITCGYGNEGTPPCHFSPQTENNYLAYGSVSARALNATVHVESWSGKGVVRNYGSPNMTSPNPMPSYWNQSVANVPSSMWNFARFVPDAIVINLGTNDYSTQPYPTSSIFVYGYNQLIADIANSYAPAVVPLVLVCGPLATTPAHCANVQAVASFNNATFLNMNGVLSANDYGCDGHPSVSGHAKMSAVLVPVLQQLLGW